MYEYLKILGEGVEPLNSPAFATYIGYILHDLHYEQ